MIFLISFFVTLLINDDKIEGLDPNILKVYYDDINKDIKPSLAGSIDLPGEKVNNDFRIYDDVMYMNMLRNRNEFKEQKKPEIIKPEDNKKLYDKRFSDYAPYEKILPPIDFAEYKRIQDLNKDIISTNARRELIQENTNKNCQGIWGDWDESICSPGKMCSIRSRTYKVIKPKSTGGRDCLYKDGEVEHGYCYGETNEGRCGLPSNICDCDVDNYDEQKCNKDTMNLDCNCPNGYRLSNRGKCIIETPDMNNNSNLSNNEINTLRNIIQQQGLVSASGTGNSPNLLILSALYEYEDKVDREIEDIYQKIDNVPTSQDNSIAESNEP